jgi:UDP-N-acetylmuramate dehydrogenase
MNFSTQFQLQKSNSLNFSSVSQRIYFPDDINELNQVAAAVSEPYYILGEGSNTLFLDDKAPTIIKPRFSGINIEETQGYYIVSVGASENWNDLVRYTVQQGVFGLENLALIPGSVGAAPVQNIGAYGVEIADYCTGVQWYELATQTVHQLDNKDCEFAYRDSIFKRRLHNKGIICKVWFTLPKQWQPSLKYAGLNALTANATAAQVMSKVIALRQTKLPDPDVLPNAGSFFKNPVVSDSQYQQLQQTYGDLPHYLQSDGSIKLAAAWLIEHTGLKGYRDKGVGVHQKQALVLVNYCSTSGRDLLELAKYIQRMVVEKFDIRLQAEVRLVSASGEVLFNERDL